MTTGEALDGLVTDSEREEVMGGQYGRLINEIPPGGNYLHYTERRVTQTHCSSGAADTGHFYSSWTRTSHRPRFKRNRARTSARSIGRIGGCVWQRSSVCSRTRMSSSWSAHAAVFRRSSATPSHHC